MRQCCYNVTNSPQIKDLLHLVRVNECHWYELHLCQLNLSCQNDVCMLKIHKMRFKCRDTEINDTTADNKQVIYELQLCTWFVNVDGCLGRW